MGPWRLEILRLWRTRRLIALAGTFLILGLGIPVLTYYLPEIVKNTASGVQVTVPKQTAADSIAGFASNVGQLGTLVVVVVAAASLESTPIRIWPRLPEPRPPVDLSGATTIRSRYRRQRGGAGPWHPRRLVRDGVLFGPISARALMAGLATQASWFCFVTAIVAVVASAIRGVLGVVGTSMVVARVGATGQSSRGLYPAAYRLAGSGADFIQHATDGIWRRLQSRSWSWCRGGSGIAPPGTASALGCHDAFPVCGSTRNCTAQG